MIRRSESGYWTACLNPSSRRVNSFIFVSILVSTAVGVFGFIYYPIIGAVALSLSLAIVSLAKLDGWWRKAFALALVTLYMGSSSLDLLASAGSVAKIAGVFALLLASCVGAGGGRGRSGSRVQRVLFFTLWSVVVLAAVSLLWSRAPAETFLDGATFFVLVFVVQRESRRRWIDRGVLAGDMLVAFVVTMLFLTAGGLLAGFGFPEAVRTGGRHQWLLNNPNSLGIMAGLTLSLGIGLALHYRSKFIWLSLIVPSAAVILSQSRTALVAVIIAIMWVAARHGLIVIARVGLVLVVGFIVFQGADVFERFSSDNADPLSLRTYVWDEAVSTLLANPLGLGWAASPAALESFYERGVTHSGIFSAHNSFLQVLLEIGWAGLVPLVVLLLLVMVVLVRSPVAGLNAGLVAAVMFGFLVHFTESVIFGVGSPYPWLYWSIVAAAAGQIEPRSGVERRMTESMTPLVPWGQGGV